MAVRVGEFPTHPGGAKSGEHYRPKGSQVRWVDPHGAAIGKALLSTVASWWAERRLRERSWGPGDPRGIRHCRTGVDSLLPHTQEPGSVRRRANGWGCLVDVIVLIGRILFVAIFLASGVAHLTQTRDMEG
jgi:hypothetical protein